MARSGALLPIVPSNSIGLNVPPRGFRNRRPSAQRLGRLGRISLQEGQSCWNGRNRLLDQSSKRNAEYRITPSELGGAASRRASARANSALSGGLCRAPCEGPSRGRPLQLAANLVVAPGGRPSYPQRQPRRRSGLCQVAQLRDPCGCWFPRVLDVFTRGYPVLGTTFLTPISG